MAVRIVTDSTADLAPELAGELGIKVVPLSVIFGQETYLDGVDLDATAFFRKLAASPVLPRTTQPSPAAFSQVYRELTDQGDEVVSIHISGKLSGTLNSALIARQEMGDPEAITIVDSRWTTMSQGIVVLHAARAAQRGASRAEVLQATDEAIQHMNLFLFCGTLEYLQRGGRIGKAAAFLGGLLNVMPMITLQQGEVHPVERVRTRRRALERLGEWAQGFQTAREFCVLHSASPQDAEALHAQLSQRFPGATAHMAQVGPVIGTHVGPGAVGVALLAS
ncbi:MAG: DegV family protein [Chloroflexi bacterium]|nr:DegV family protein [Chloroflexota bacterium]